MKKNMFSVIALSSLLLGACASMSDDPMKRAAFADKTTVTLESKLENAKLAWIARELLEPDARREAAKLIADADIDVPWGKNEYSTLSSMATDAFVGEVGSSMGAHVGGAVMLAGLLTGDGSIPNDSGVYLPPILDGIELDTAMKAQTVYATTLREKINAAAEQYGYTAICLHGCEQNSINTAYHLIQKPSVTPQFDHQPEEMGISFFIGELEESTEEVVIDSKATGLPVKWVSKENNSALLLINRIDEKGEDGKPILYKADRTDGDFRLVKGHLWLQRTPFGRALMRDILNNPYHYVGGDFMRMLAYDGELYEFFTNGNINVFDERITN
tara:strand:+ start:12405 stop:13394 length:990 start_codon:yes stop_codon:yes gene_type:complete